MPTFFTKVFWHTPQGKKIEKILMVIFGILAFFLATGNVLIFLAAKMNIYWVDLAKKCQQQEKLRIALNQCPNGDVLITALPADPTNPLDVPFDSGIAVYTPKGFLLKSYGSRAKQITFFSKLREQKQQPIGCANIETISYCTLQEK